MNFTCVHVLRRKILRLAASRRKVHYEDPVGRQTVEIAHDSLADFSRIGTVPTGERLDGAVFVRRCFEVRGDVADREDRYLLPGALGDEGGGENEEEQNLYSGLHRSLVRKYTPPFAFAHCVPNFRHLPLASGMHWLIEEIKVSNRAFQTGTEPGET